MTAEQKIKIEEFIKNNNLTFKEGKRNTDSVVLSGYALHLGLGDVYAIRNVVDEVLPDADEDYFDEFNRVFDYAESNNYGKWWRSKTAKKTYKF